MKLVLCVTLLALGACSASRPPREGAGDQISYLTTSATANDAECVAFVDRPQIHCTDWRTP